ncbi:MAG: response regulator [Phaeodactylibacter sp.]|nr:response regulator [Phaeodactylibacter sp.]
MNLAAFFIGKNTRLLLRLLPFLFLTGAAGSLSAQHNPASAFNDSLRVRIGARLEQQKSDTAFHFLLQEVRGACGQDLDCLFRTYYDVMTELEQRFMLSGCIYVCEEMLKVARRKKDLKMEAEAYIHLSRFHDALGIHRPAELYIDKALALFEQVDSSSAILRTKMAKLERTMRYRKVEDVLDDMDVLLAEAKEKGDSIAIYHIHARMIRPSIRTGRYEEAYQHIAAIESMPLSRPARPVVVGWLIIAAWARGQLALINNEAGEAERNFRKALQLCAEDAHPWLEVSILDDLAELEWNRGNRERAKNYVARAHEQALSRQVDELLVKTHEWKAYIAEQEGRYQDALQHTKKKFFHKEQFKNRSAGFNLENYYLQLEKKQLAAGKQNQELELSLRKTQLRTSLIIIVLVFLLAAGLLAGLYQQRKGRRELAAQHALIQEQAAQLKQLDKAKSRFFANISHELRTPLTLMLGPIGLLLKEKQLSGYQTHLLHMARQSGRQLERLITEILDLRKLESGKMTLEEQPTRLAPFFRQYFSQFESLAEQKRIGFSYELLAGEDVAVLIDRSKCRQVLYNLLSNAFKFTPAGGRIEGRLSLNNGMLELTVADTGPGIHPDALPYIFDRYYQAPTALPNSSQGGGLAEAGRLKAGHDKFGDQGGAGGTGIGLALCREYARLFGGKIEVESQPGEGAVFRVAFPVALPDAPSAGAGNAPDTLPDGGPQPPADALAAHPLCLTGAEKATAAAKAGQPRPTILVVEDNPELQDYLRLILSERYDVVTAENGQAALSRLATTPPLHPALTPSLIISDLMMPVMDGYQLLERLKGNDATRHIPVIMLTARAGLPDKLKALRIGVDDYLTKPFDEEELLARIGNLLDNQAARLREAAEAGGEGMAAPAMSGEDRDWLEAFETYVRENLDNSFLSVSGLAHEFAMSESTLLRQLKRLAGLTPNQYLQEMRLDKARRLLENATYNSVARVAAEVGYSDPRSFSRSFKKRFGKLPSTMLETT